MVRNKWPLAVVGCLEKCTGIFPVDKSENNTDKQTTESDQQMKY